MNERVRIPAKKPDAKRENRAFQTRKTDLSQSISSPVDHIMSLQRTIGNQAVQRLIKSGALQTKLRIGMPGDIYEQEADRVAERVMRMHEPQRISSYESYIQRVCTGCDEEKLQRQPIKEEEEEEEPLQTKEISGRDTEIPIDIESRINVIKGGGQPLPESVRAYFEPRFGYDFSQVQAHTAAQAADTARMVNAHAFTMGRDIVFGAGQYEPGTAVGRKLLAHELTHVVQQQSLLGRRACPITRVYQLVVQRDLARPPRRAPAPLRVLTPEETQAAIAYNQNRFSDPYSIRVIRDVLGLEPLPAVVDEDFVRAVVEWQAERRMNQDGQIGHPTTRSLYLELVAEGEFRDAIVLLMDSYRLPGDLRLHDVRVGTGLNCCSTATVPVADAVTSGGPHCGGGPLDICFCRTRIPRNVAQYDHFVRIAGHELLHVPHCAVGPTNPNVREFEAYYWEACGRGRAPRLSAAQRIGHANTALAHFALIPAALQTPARIAMRNQLVNLVAAGGIGPC